MLLATVAAASGLALGFWLLREEPTCEDLGFAASMLEGEVFEVRCVPAFVVRLGGRPVVYLARSPHLGERLLWDQRRRLFHGQHGESFAADGEPVEGPGSRPLWRCPTTGTGTGLRIAVRSRPSQEDFEAVCKRLSP